MAEISGFIFYRSFYEAIKKLPKEYQAELYIAICEYVFDCKEPKNLSGVAEAIFILIKPNIDSATKRYEASVENGKKGGRPAKNKNPEETQQKPKKNPEETQQKPKQKPDENLDKDKDKDKDIDIDKDKDIDKKEKINKKEKKSLSEEFEEIILNNFSDDEVLDCVREFIKMRKSIKKPLTKRGLELMIKKLYKLTTNVDEQIEILNNSIMNNWQGIYPLKKNNNPNNTGNFNDFKELWEEAKLKDEQARNNTDNSTFGW